MNSIHITGRICAEPERRTSNSGKSVTSINVAVKRPFTKDTTDFLTVILWEKKCDYICQYGHKGDMVAVSGVLTTRSWEDNNGNKRTSYEIVSDTVELVGGTKTEQNAQQPANISQLQPYNPNSQSNQQDFITIVSDEELPF